MSVDNPKHNRALWLKRRVAAGCSIALSDANGGRSRLRSRAGRFGLVPSTTLSPSVRHGYALGSMSTLHRPLLRCGVSDDPNIIALISRSLAQTARSRLLSWAGRFGLVPSTTLSPSVRRGYALSLMGT